MFRTSWVNPQRDNSICNMVRSTYHVAHTLLAVAQSEKTVESVTIRVFYIHVTVHRDKFPYNKTN
jgi:hypothetical protein